MTAYWASAFFPNSGVLVIPVVKVVSCTLPTGRVPGTISFVGFFVFPLALTVRLVMVPDALGNLESAFCFAFMGQELNQPPGMD